MNIRGRTALLLAAAALLGPLAACSGAVNRTGAAAAEQVATLRAINPLAPSEVQAYTDTLARLSRGSLRLDLTSLWHLDSSHGEQEAVRAVQDGKADLAFIPARAWHEIGTTSFDALIAPFAIDSYTEERAVLAGDLPRRLISSEPAPGVTALGILPGPLRKPDGITTRLVDPADYRGRAVGLNESAVGSAYFTALGARPVPTVFTGHPLVGLDGVEQQVESIGGNRYDTSVRTIAANVDLWPRPIVVVANAAALHRLTATQRQQLSDATRQSLDASIAALQRSEAEQIGDLCRRGRVQFVTAGPASLGALRTAARPVLAWLSADPTTRAALGTIAQVRASVADQAASEAAPSCAGIAPSTVALPAATGARGPLDGTWLMSETTADVIAAGAPLEDSNAPENAGRWVFLVAGGRFSYTQANGAACTWGYGTWTVDGDHVEWRFVDGGGAAPSGATNKPGELFDYTWSVFHETLTLGKVPGAVSPENFIARAWHRVSRSVQPQRNFPCGLPAAGVPR